MAGFMPVSFCTNSICVHLLLYEGVNTIHCDGLLVLGVFNHKIDRTHEDVTTFHVHALHCRSEALFAACACKMSLRSDICSSHIISCCCHL